MVDRKLQSLTLLWAGNRSVIMHAAESESKNLPLKRHPGKILLKVFPSGIKSFKFLTMRPQNGLRVQNVPEFSLNFTRLWAWAGARADLKHAFGSCQKQLSSGFATLPTWFNIYFFFFFFKLSSNAGSLCSAWLIFLFKTLTACEASNRTINCFYLTLEPVIQCDSSRS